MSKSVYSIHLENHALYMTSGYEVLYLSNRLTTSFLILGLPSDNPHSLPSLHFCCNVAKKSPSHVLSASEVMSLLSCFSSASDHGPFSPRNC